jgi:predicted pyridoxine 5'-phosphate oxidase superfamily flavin-nucleotide-binding protein
MGILTEEMKRVVTEIQLCYAATVTPDGKPNLSPKGSITVLGDDELGFADLASPGTIENLRHNPRSSNGERRRAVAKGQDIYAITAPLACAAIER